MRTSNKGMLEILSHEWIVLSRYKDIKGIWTIGAGHTKAAGGLNPEEFMGEITASDAIELFREDLVQYEKGVNKAFTRVLTQEQFDAAVSFNFNTGAIQRASWVKHFNKNNDSKAEFSSKSGIMAWRKPKRIIGRRQKERDLFFHGVYTNNGTVNVYKSFDSGKLDWKSRQIITPDFHEEQIPIEAKAMTDGWWQRYFKLANEAKEWQT